MDVDGNVQRRSSRSSSLAQTPTNEDDDSDTISLTSTIESEDPPDTEYVVEGVHAEREQEIDGKIQPVYLVEWANFPLDQCTWEPLNNLPPQLTEQWEKKKATEDPSVALEFEKKYMATFNARLEEARQRHRRRNAKRRRLGRQPTPFWFRGQQQSDSEYEDVSANEAQDSEAEPFNPSSDDDNEREEAVEDNAVDHKAMEALELSKSASKAKASQPVRPTSKVFTFNPGKAKISANSNSRETTVVRSQQTSARSSSSKEPHESQKSKRRDGDRTVSLSSGYQGSARKSSTADSSFSRSANASTLKAAALPSATTSTHVPASIPPTAKTTTEIAKKVFTGRKTTKSTIPVNIFAGGKKPRTRQGVGDAEIGNKHAPKLYSQAKYIRKAELRSRDRDDQAPDISKIANVIFAPGSKAEILNSAPQGQASTEAGDIQGTPGIVPEEPEEQPSIVPPNRSGKAIGPTDLPRHSGPPKRSSMSSGATDAGRPNKRAKKVHFTEVDAGPSVQYESSAKRTRSERFPGADEEYRTTGKECLFVDEPMDIDSPPDPSPDQQFDFPSSAATGARRQSLSAYKSRNIQSVKSVSKKLRLSTSPGNILDVTFNAMPAATSIDSAQQWLVDFLDMNCLEMGHLVLAETFIAQLLSPSSQRFQPLCAGTLTSTIYGEDLKVLAEHLRISSSGLFLAQTHFNLIVFPTKCSDFDGLSNFGVEPTSPDGAALKYLMFGSAIPIFQQIRPSSSANRPLESRVGEEKVVLFPTILGIQYSVLITSADKEKKKPGHFFLAFPQRAIEWQRSLASWLSTREKTCKIYTNFVPGSWLAFVEKAKIERGVVIVHEALVPFLRRFPKLANLLVKYPVNVWHFSESLDMGPPKPLVGSRIIPAMSTKLSRLFPFGSAVLITPSFVVSEPQAVFRLLKWFYEKRAKQGNHKLVVAYNFLEYLTELSREKSALRTHLQKKLWNRKSPEYVAMDKNKAALTDEDLGARQKTWMYMGWWLSEQVHSQAPFSDINPTIIADRSIDPHDEQSLVNWFGWWSMAHSHEYRKFYVVGSSSKSDGDLVHTLTSRTSRKVPVPKYCPSIVNDPDEVLREILIKQRPADPGFQSQWFHNDENRIGPWLQTRDRGLSSLKLYPSPVSWVDKAMAAHYGDPSMSFKLIEQWWNSIVPWMSGSYHYNTFVGFFYTISEEWDPEKPPQAIKPRRHPWLAIWRPVNPHEKGTLYSHGRTELIIWDVRAGAELEKNPSLHLNHLTWMQRELVKHIQLHAHEKNPNSFLENVWLGGFQVHQFPLQSKEPADMTAEFLMRIVANLKRTLAGAAHFLVVNGYRQVALRMGPSDTDNKEQVGYDDDPDTRIIFHAPRGSGHLQPRGVSNCINQLFEEARRNKPYKDMVYTYPPTMTWYQKQRDEGRQFEHIWVDEWDKVFTVMGVDKPQPGSVSASSGRANQASARSGSVSSSHSNAPSGISMA
ncbi:hypothetical protein N0V82_006587 [Gnomoniopsis sp. IMI 355080]|nr:hypothetical protein N0V82_006587 [Gnomoniopsis sp. IMI 355080]